MRSPPPRSRPRPRGATSAACAGSTADVDGRRDRARRVAPARRGRARSSARPGAQREGADRSRAAATRATRDGVRAHQGPVADREAARGRRSSRRSRRARRRPMSPRHRAGARRAPRAQRWAELLLAIVQLVAEQHRRRPAPARHALRCRGGRARRRRARPATAHKLPVLTTWRRDVIGELFVQFFEGTLAIAGDLTAPGGMRLIQDQPTQK